MGDDEEGDPRVEEPRRRLAEQVDLELVPLRRDGLVAQHQGEIAADHHDEARPRHVVGHEEEDHGRVDHQPVGERVGHLAELRLDPPATRQEAVDLVGDAGDAEDDPRRPAVTAVCRQHERHEERDQEEAGDGQRIRKLLQRSGNRSRRHVARIVPSG